MERLERLDELQTLFYQQPEGFKLSELAKRYGVDRRTIRRDLLALQGEPYRLPLEEGAGWRWRMMEDHRFRLPPVHLSLQEAAALYLAARLLDRVSDEPNPFVLRALLALAKVLPPEVGQQIQEIVSLRPREGEGVFARAFEAISEGWARRRKVRLRYQPMGSDCPREYVVSPYLLESSEAESAYYLIGGVGHAGEVRTFKLERVHAAEVLAESFRVPEGFKSRAFLASAWGVMFGDQTTEVVLRVAPEAERWIKEKTWHPSQQLEALPGGGCVLRVQVAHPEEMRRFIRQWGASIEVLAPPALREEIAQEAARTAALYDAEGAR